MTGEQKQQLHNEVQGMFRGLGSSGGTQRQWYRQDNENEQDKRGSEPANATGQGAGAPNLRSKPRPNSRSSKRRATR